MITMLDEETPAAGEESKDPAQDPMQFINQLMRGFGGGRGGRGGGGRFGRGGRNRECHGGGGPPFQKMMEQFTSKMGEWGEWAKQNPEEFQKKMQSCGNKWKNFNGKHGWKEARAVCVRKPEQVLQIAPGMTQIVEIEVLNDTYWPWKAGCALTLSDE